MNRKIKNTLALLALLILIIVAGGIYVFIVQAGNIRERHERLTELRANQYDVEQLNEQYESLLIRVAVLDSVLAARKFNIPQNLSSIKFFDFIADLSANFNQDTKLDVEYTNQSQDKEFFFYQYRIAGGGPYSDVFQLVYGIEQSKELKKIPTLTLSNLVTTNKEGFPLFHVNFNFMVDVYYSSNDRFTTAYLVENNLTAPYAYDAFYPLIRNEIPPNIDQLLDVQGAKLLALIPEGAFLADSRGNTYLLWEGEQVYLGYLTNIDYKNNKVSFILNKGGIIEKEEISLERSESRINKK
jgi:hypothetical protein